jgi:hypothetical protein
MINANENATAIENEINTVTVVNRSSLSINDDTTVIKNQSEQKIEEDDDDDEEDIVSLAEMPTTFEEIYELSNRNRKRNKDKKKSAKDSDDIDSTLHISNSSFSVDTSTFTNVIHDDSATDSIDMATVQANTKNNITTSTSNTLNSTSQITDVFSLPPAAMSTHDMHATVFSTSASAMPFDESIYFNTAPIQLPEDVVRYTVRFIILVCELCMNKCMNEWYCFHCSLE